MLLTLDERQGTLWTDTVTKSPALNVVGLKYKSTSVRLYMNYQMSHYAECPASK